MREYKFSKEEQEMELNYKAIFYHLYSKSNG